MSGFSPFGLNALGALGSSRLSDLMPSSRNQNNNYRERRENNNMEDDFFSRSSGGRMMGGGNRRRSVSPPRHYSRDNERPNNHQRGRRGSRGNDSFGKESFGSAGAGILGAAPELAAASSLSGLSDIGSQLGNTPFNESPSNVSQLNSQAQQLLNVMQTQQLLAAVQAQANIANSKPPSLMQGISPRSRGGGRFMNQSSQRFERSWQGRDRPRDNRKRRFSPPRNPYPKKDRKDNTDRNSSRRSSITKGKEESGKKERKDEKPKDKQVVNKKTAKSEVAHDKKPVAKKQVKKAEPAEEVTIEKNAAKEDIEALVKANFDGTRYWCSLCKIVCLKSKNIYKHFVSERHVKSAVESQGKVFDPAIMEEPKEEKVEDFLKYDCSSKKTARKENDDVFISSFHECTVRIKNFTAHKNFMGTEFVKAISGFKCLLCKIFIPGGDHVLQHIQGKKHKSNYSAHLEENPNYQESTIKVNKNLINLLSEQEGKDVVLFEHKNNKVTGGAEAKDETDDAKCDLEDMVTEDETTFNMDEYEQEETGRIEEQEEPTTASVEDEKHCEEATEHKVDDQQKSGDEEEEKMAIEEEVAAVEDTPAASDGELEDSNIEEKDDEKEVEKDLFQDYVLEEEDSDEESQEEVENLLKTPSEENVPIIPEVSKPKEKAKVQAPVKTEVITEEEKTEEVKVAQDVVEVPETKVKEEAIEEAVVTPPARRGGKKGRGRGRGGTTARGGRGGKTTRKSVRVKKAVTVETKTEDDELAVKESSNEDISFIDGFEVIDEIVGGEDDT